MAMEYFYELFTDLPRQGPGCREATLRALGLLKDLPAKPGVLDIGCGCGMQTLILARQLKTKIVAIDNHRPLLDRLDEAAARSGLEVRQMAAASDYRVIESSICPTATGGDYYSPMLKRMEELKARNAGVAEAEAVYAHCTAEIEMFRRHSKSYGYTFFVLQRI